MEKKDTAPSAAGKAREENAAIAYSPPKLWNESKRDIIQHKKMIAAKKLKKYYTH